MEHFTCKQSILKEHNIRLVSCIGNFNIDEVSSFKSEENKSLQKPQNMDVICDIRQVSFDTITDEISQLSRLLKSAGDLDSKRKTAIITETFNQHVYANIFCKLNAGYPNQVKVFLTLKDALKWLQSKITTEEIELTLHRMSHQRSALKNSKTIAI